MSKQLSIAKWELYLSWAFFMLMGALANTALTPAHAATLGGDTPGITFSANRMACALEGIQHALEHLEHIK